MSQENKTSNQWPKAFVAVFGTASISAAAYLLREPEVMWAMFPLVWLVNWF